MSEETVEEWLNQRAETPNYEHSPVSLKNALLAVKKAREESSLNNEIDWMVANKKDREKACRETAKKIFEAIEGISDSDDFEEVAWAKIKARFLKEPNNE